MRKIVAWTVLVLSLLAKPTSAAVDPLRGESGEGDVETLVFCVHVTDQPEPHVPRSC